jgi:hypothetical protein
MALFEDTSKGPGGSWIPEVLTGVRVALVPPSLDLRLLEKHAPWSRR